MYQSACYFFFEEQKNFNDSQNHCRSLGAELASVHGDGEHYYIYERWVSTAGIKDNKLNLSVQIVSIKKDAYSDLWRNSKFQNTPSQNI